MTTKPWHHDGRSRHERGYGYAWVKKREQILRRDGYRCRCEDCKRDNRIRPATQVDHIVSKAAWLKLHGNLDRVDDDSNLRAINSECHERKSVLERGRAQAVRVGEDGFPIEW